MAKWELTSKLGPFLDRHLVIPLLEFLSVNGKDVYDVNDLLRGKLELLSNTNMVDFAMDVHKNLYPDQDVPKELVEKRPKVVEKFTQLQNMTEPISAIFQDPEAAHQIQNSRDSKQLVEYLVEKHNFKLEMIDTCYDFAKFCYEIGNYQGTFAK